ncbi:chemotaxis protein CheW [Pontibacter pamirensis]|uniref:chemotaxis protein CheW n=1 Tax=Pontibacter pamirensis TaxID=2562824 RepID=UPI00138A0BE9|nr:chemotaxis protein CheW [Pontibacter pamirensis]
MAKQTQTADKTAEKPAENDKAAAMDAPAAEGKKAAEPQPVKEEMVHLIVFKLGAEYYAIKIEQVKEVNITPATTRMPRTPHFVKGVANIRGDIIAIIDLEDRFNIRPAPLLDGLNPDLTYTLVIEAKGYSIGVTVKEMPQSLNLPISKIDKAPSFLQDVNISENFIEGLARTGDRLIIVLDMHKILTQDEVRELPG